ncbi:unnamed protein product [Nesidiocoris tenuis]|uniref:Coronin n=1 Tax=Nesidiocoris tenuis TaxID=355587 RepID=A0A6H5H341_9HEMI|nr:unnamed protein product [Nesidiocoris tenuis]
MSFRVVRSSKFRHVYGTPLKREQCYDNIRVSKSSWDSTFCAVNPKFLAIIVESAGGGAFIVLPHNKAVGATWRNEWVFLDLGFWNQLGQRPKECILKFSLFYALSSRTLSFRTLTEPIVDLIHHQRRVGLVLWHPTALNVLLTAGSDNQVAIWNVGTGEILAQIDCHPDIVYSACWNWDGSQLLTTCKDKKMRIINPRTGVVEEEAICHEGSKATRAIYLKSGLIFTTGFSKMSERQYSLRAPEHLTEPIVMVELDTSNGVMFPIYDPDTNLVYLCGKNHFLNKCLCVRVSVCPSVVIYKNGHNSLISKPFFKFLELKCLSRQDLTPCLIGIWITHTFFSFFHDPSSSTSSAHAPCKASQIATDPDRDAVLGQLAIFPTWPNCTLTEINEKPVVHGHTDTRTDGHTDTCSGSDSE